MPRRTTQHDIARRVGVDQGSVSRILNKNTRDSFAPETVAKVFKIARELGYLHPALVSSNRRESPRKRVNVPARLRVVIGANTVFDEGSVEITELSQSGCTLRSFRTKKGVLPLDRFRFDVEVGDGRLKDFATRCRLIRFSGDDSEFALAVQFEPLSADKREILRSFLR